MDEVKKYFFWIVKILTFISLIFVIFDINSIFDKINWLVKFSINGNIIRWIVGIILLIVFIFSCRSILKKIKFGKIEWFDLDRKIHHISSSQDNLPLVGHFGLNAKNRKSKQIKVLDSYIESLVTGDKLPVYINNIEAKNIFIQPKSNFSVICPFPDNGGNRSIKGMTFGSFRSKFSYFRFIFKIEKKTYNFKMDSTEVDEWMKSLMLMNLPSPGQKSTFLKS
jgi:hypothetical protein